jgi:hypothetical protein
MLRHYPRVGSLALVEETAFLHDYLQSQKIFQT